MGNFFKLKSKHIKLGKWGEKIACRFLKNKFYSILLRNYKVKSGEIDIIARDGETICFVEVKTRRFSKLKVAEAKALVSNAQIKRIKNASKEYLFEIGKPKVKYRFELIEVFLKGYTLKTVYHWTNDFGKNTQGY